LRNIQIYVFLGGGVLLGRGFSAGRIFHGNKNFKGDFSRGNSTQGESGISRHCLKIDQKSKTFYHNSLRKIVEP